MKFQKLSSLYTLAILLVLFLFQTSQPSAASPAHITTQNTITVNTTSGDTRHDTLCTLRAAITAANTDRSQGGCPAGNGADTIMLVNNATFNLYDIDNTQNGNNALPSITSQITINGNNATLQRIGSNVIRFFHVASNGTLTLNNLTLYNGRATTGDVDCGGGAMFTFGTVTLNEITFSQNQATDLQDGGAICNSKNNNSPGSLTINRSTFVSNIAHDDGGAIRNDGNIDIRNSTFSGNRADGQGLEGGSGGAVYTRRNSTTTFNNSTVTNNYASTTGGGVEHQTGQNGITYIKNSILAGNTIGSGTMNDCGASGTTSSQGYNLVGQSNNSRGCPSNGVGDLILSGLISSAIGTLQNNGGTTLTHALVTNSPAIDRGDPGSSCESMDQRGVSRPQGGRCDIGSYELEVAPPTVQLSASNDYDIGENHGSATIVVTLSKATSNTVQVNYATTSGSAIAGSDYTAVSGTLIFNANVTVAVFSIPIINDSRDEPNENFTLSLSNPVNATLGSPSSASVLITDDDPEPTVAFSSSSYSATESSSAATITVNLSTASDKTISVSYQTSNGTAVSGSDYTATNGTFTFTPGQTSKTFNIPILNDTRDEFNETINLSLSNPTNATLGTPNSSVLTIIDNDSEPTLAFNSSSYSVSEGSGTKSITVNLSTASNKTITVHYQTSNGTAVSGSDYTATNGTLTFTPDQTSKTFTVIIREDSLIESNETINLTLSNASNAILTNPSNSTLTILDNDSAPSPTYTTFLPVLAKGLYLGPWETEPNNTYTQANGPVPTGQAYHGYPNDNKDYFFFEIREFGYMSIDLKDYTGIGQLQLFYQNTNNRVALDTEPPYHLNYIGPAGTYYIYIATTSGFNSTTPYHLTATYGYYFNGSWEQEENNSTAQANGRLRPNQAYYGYPNDQRDYFFIELNQPGHIVVDLQGYHNTGQLQLLSANGRITYDTEPPYYLDYQNAPAGIYYIYIFTDNGFNNTIPYTLTVDY